MLEWLHPIEMFERMSEWHPAIGSLYGIVGMIGIIIAGVWTAMRFYRRREGKEKAVLQQDVEIFKINSTDKCLVRVKLKVKNIGAVKVRPYKSIITIYRVFPTTNKELNELLENREKKWGGDLATADDTLEWEVIKDGRRSQNLKEDDFLLEPGEETEIWSDFIISNEYEMIQVYSKVQCTKSDTNLKWDVVSFHKL